MDKEQIKIENFGREELRVEVPLNLGSMMVVVTLTTGAQVNENQWYIYRYDINEAVIRSLTDDLNEAVVFATMDPRLVTELRIVRGKGARLPGPDDKEVALNLRTVFPINGLLTFVTLNAEVAVRGAVSDQTWALIHNAVSAVLLRNLTEANIIRHMKK